MEFTQDYITLLQDYRDLQIRVSRFSSIQQQLINTRDQLDNELMYYKQLIEYNSKVLHEPDDARFIVLTAETIVEIFETDIAIFILENKSDAGKTIVYTEGFKNNNTENSRRIFADAVQLSRAHQQGKSHLLTSDMLSQLGYLNICSRGIFYYFTDKESGYTGYLFALISRKNAPIYKSVQFREDSLFSIFCQQVDAILGNRKKAYTINAQLADIRRSNIELLKLSLIATRTKNGVIIADSNGNTEWVNNAFVDATGYTLDEIKGKKPGHVLQGAQTDPVIRHKINAAIQARETVEVVITNYRKTGELFYNHLEITPVFDDTGKLINFIALQKDITNEFLHQSEMAGINSRYELIAQKSHIGIWEWNAVANTVTWNDTLLAIFGAEREKVQHDFFGFWKSIISKEDSELVFRGMDKLLSNQEEFNELEYNVVLPATGEKRIVKSLTIAERDSAGQLIRLFGTTVDVTSDREYEQKLLLKNDELNKINHELDNFVYSVSHDLRSPLLSIKGLIDLIFTDPDLSAQVSEYLKLIDSSVGRLDETIKEILDYSRNARLDLETSEFNIMEMISSIFNDLKFSVAETVACNVSVTGSPILCTDKARLSTVVKNVIGNSFKYLNKEKDGAYINVHVDNAPDKITIDIADNGIGMNTATLDKVFNMFYRGTNQASGTGLGLYICREIINKMKGTITMDSTLHVGSTVTITIPLTS